MNFEPDLQGFQIDETIAEIDTEPVEPVQNSRFSKEVIEWLEVIATAVIAVVVIFCFIFRVATIDGDSMLNTLYGGDIYGRNADKVIITNFGYEPDNGDIVVISRNAENSIETQSTSQGPIIKRVIAKGGQTVDIDFETGKVYVDGVELKEDYISSPTTNRADVEFLATIPLL